MPSLSLRLAINSMTVMGAWGTPAAPVNLGVSIAGTGEAGTVHSIALTYDDPQPYPPPQRTIQWYRDGVAILGATSASYTPVDTYALTVTVSVSNSEGSAGPATSAAVNLTPGYTADPEISGTLVVGEELTVSTPVTIGTVNTLTYRWKRNGEIIATGNTYTTTNDDADAELTAEVLLTNAAGTTIAIADPVFVVFAAPTVQITDITDGGFTDVTDFVATVETTGVIARSLIQWYSAADPSVILAEGSPARFSVGVADLKATAYVWNPDEVMASADSAETAVVQQAEAATVASATIDRGGQAVPPGTVLTATISATGSPAVFTTSVQWRDNGSPISGATSTLYTVGAGVAGPITYSYTVSNGVEPPATGSSSDSVTVAVDNTPTLDGIPDFVLEQTDPIATDDLTSRGVNLAGAVWGLDLEAASDDGTESVGFTTGDYAFIAYQRFFVGADRWTATGTAQATNPFVGSPAALPTGFANSEQDGVLRIADTVAAGSYSVKIWGGDGTSADSITLTLVGSAAGAPTIPPAPPAANWTLTDPADGRLAITIVSALPDGGSALTDREYEIDDSGTWVSIGATPATGTFYIPAASLTLDQEASVKLRSTNALTSGAWNESVAKTATPTATAAPFTLAIALGSPVWTGVPPASLTIVKGSPVWSV